MIRVIGPKDKKDPNAVNTTSHSPLDWSRGLSPFFLGPCKLWAGFEARILENAWQYSKVYKEHLDAEGNPSDDWWKWARSGWSRSTPVRYPMGKGAKPEFAYWKGRKLDYITARKQIYIPLYADAVRKTDAWTKLRELYQKQGSVTLWDFDGYDHHALGMTLNDVMNNPARSMGHAFVLAMLLSMEFPELAAKVPPPVPKPEPKPEKESPFF